jgi:ABC-type transporter Mla subunit MlaD
LCLYCIMQIRIRHDVYIHTNPEQDSEVVKLLRELKIINQNTMESIDQLIEKVNALQTSLDAEQQEIQDAIAALNTTVQELRDQIANNEGGTVEERQALADKLDAIKSDLEGTVNTTPTEPTEPEA